MLSHVNKENLPHMVDITKKKFCVRKAVGRTTMKLHERIMRRLFDDDIVTPKGSVFATAVVAGVQAVKNTAGIIPMCHSIPISFCNIDIVPDTTENTLTITCAVSSAYSTGVEIEALTGSSVAAITIYDMCKSITGDMVIQETKLLSKEKQDIMEKPGHEYNR